MSKKKIIIDGYNLIKSHEVSFPKLISLESQRDHLLKVLNSSPALHSKNVIVVFDGSQLGITSGGFKHQQIRVIFSGKNKLADDVIQEMIRRDLHPEQLSIVTSDRTIQFTAKDHGAETIESPAFWKKIHNQHSAKKNKQSILSEKDKNLSDKEVQEWMQIFKNRNVEDDEN